MRACKNDPQFLTDHNNLFGVCLSADFCAEHEWGISSLEAEFGIFGFSEIEKPYDASRFKATKVPKTLNYQEHPTFSILTVGHYGSEIPYPLRKCVFKGAWDAHSFGIVAKKKTDVKKLFQLKQAIEEENVAIWLANSSAFENSPLVIAIYDKIPKVHLDEMAEKLQETAKLYTVANEIGMKEKLLQHGVKFLELTPYWSEKFKLKNTKFPIVFWLNPLNWIEAGYYSVEELNELCENKK